MIVILWWLTVCHFIRICYLQAPQSAPFRYPDDGLIPIGHTLLLGYLTFWFQITISSLHPSQEFQVSLMSSFIGVGGCLKGTHLMAYLLLLVHLLLHLDLHLLLKHFLLELISIGSQLNILLFAALPPQNFRKACSLLASTTYDHPNTEHITTSTNTKSNTNTSTLPVVQMDSGFTLPIKSESNVMLYELEPVNSMMFNSTKYWSYVNGLLFPKEKVTGTMSKNKTIPIDVSILGILSKLTVYQRKNVKDSTMTATRH